MNVKLGLKAKMKSGEYVRNVGYCDYNWNKERQIYQIRSGKMFLDVEKYNGKYSQKYVFSGKIECGIYGANYVRRVNEK